MHFKYLANSLALVYNFYSPVYNSCELAEDYGWKDQSVMCFPSYKCVVMFVFMFAWGQAIVQV